MKNRIIRSAASVSSDIALPTTGNLVKIDTPEFLSLVGKPANQRPFPVIRSVANPVEEPPKGRVLRTKLAARRGDNAVLMLTFPEGYTEDDVNETLTLFGMEGYAVSTDGTSYYARRSDLQSIANVEAMKTEQVRITSDGIMARIDGTQYAPKGALSVAGITLSSFEFDRKTFDNEKIISWCTQNGVDISSDGIENSSTDVYLVTRAQVNEGTEVRRLALEAGVVAVVHRSDCCDVPDMFAGPVSEAAYGNYGWGQLDFNAAMADVAFCDQLDDASYRVRSVMNQILFYSELPLDMRKTLVTRCLQQYGAFINDAIDALPRQVLQLAGAAAGSAATARGATRADSSTAAQSTTQEKVAMKIDPVAAQKELDQLVAKREAEEAAAAAPAAAAVAESAAAVTDPATAAPAVAAAVADAPITRADIAAMISSGIAAALAAQAVTAVAPAASAAASQETIVSRADTAGMAAAASSATVAVATVTRDDIAALLAEQLKPLGERMERIEGTTIVRNDSGDGKQATPKKESVFRGAFGNIGTIGKPAEQ